MHDRSLRILAPAKLNLGLEIVGKREDGLHDLRTIMQTVSLFDTLELSISATTLATRTVTSHMVDVTADDPRTLRDAPGIDTESNLAARAVNALAMGQAKAAPLAIRLAKGIPPASGLGGASSDAAAALKGADDIWRTSFPADALALVAAGIGSDVPFFLSGGTALVTGKGDVIEPLPSVSDQWFVIAHPWLQQAIPRKTATLYAALCSEDLGDSGAVDGQVDRIIAQLPLDTMLLRNAFERPLYELRPDVLQFRDAMVAAGANHPALSGAGPAHYCLCSESDHAINLANRLRSQFGSAAFIGVVSSQTEKHRSISWPNVNPADGD